MNFGIFRRGAASKSEKKTLEDFIREEDDDQVEIDAEVFSETNSGKEDVPREPRRWGFGGEAFTVTPLSCFGWNKENTDKWLTKCAKAWYLIISFAWFLFGAISFAPVIFISSKVSVLFKDKKTSIIAGVIIYAIIIALLVVFFHSRGATPEV